MSSTFISGTTESFASTLVFAGPSLLIDVFVTLNFNQLLIFLFPRDVPHNILGFMLFE